MSDRPSHPDEFRRIDPPGLAHRRRRPATAPGARRVEGGGGDVESDLERRSSENAFADAATATLRERLDEHARSLGQALVARQSGIDRREGDLHARLAQIDAMRRELELWSEAERSVVAERIVELDERSEKLDFDERLRRRELDGREGALDRARAAVDASQRNLEELQRRCELAMRRIDDEPAREPNDSHGDMSGLIREALSQATMTLRIVRPDADDDDAVPADAFEEVAADPYVMEETPRRQPSSETLSRPPVPRMPLSRPTIAKPTKSATSATASSELLRLHEALLDKERFLADESRRLDRERKAFAEVRLAWLESRVQTDRSTDGRAARAELKALRSELLGERDERLRSQKRRHQRMQFLLEAIEDEIKRLDIAWASIPQAK